MDPFHDHFLLQPRNGIVDDDTSRVSPLDMLSQAKANGFPVEHWAELKAFVWKHDSKFRATFSVEQSKVYAVRFELKPHAQPIWVKLQIYSAKQGQFLRSVVVELSKHWLVYADQISA